MFYHFKLKKSKAAGFDGISVEHLSHAHPILVVHLALQFRLLYKYGLVPDDFGQGIVIPLLQNRDGNRFVSDNYRGITLSPVIGKLFEMVLLVLFENLRLSKQLAK